MKHRRKEVADVQKEILRLLKEESIGLFIEDNCLVLHDEDRQEKLYWNPNGVIVIDAES